MAEQTKAVQAYSNDQLALIKKTVAPGVSDDELKLFIEVCKSKGLNPFTRQIYAIARKDGDNGKKMTIQTGIDGYRLLAARSGKYAGQLGPEWCGKDGKWVDVWLDSEPPQAARVAALHSDFKQPLWRVAKYSSYVQKYNNKPSTLWDKMPEVMLAKCAEALALRAAFPEELSGIYTKEEMMQADTEPDLPASVLAQETIEGEVVEQETQPQANGHQAEEAQSSSIPSVKQLQARCTKLCGASYWQAMLKVALKLADGTTLLDKDITIAHRITIHKYQEYIAANMPATP